MTIKTKTIDIRLVIDDKLEVDKLIEAIGMGLEDVLAIAELRNDGFANLLPAQESIRAFIDHPISSTELVQAINDPNKVIER